MKSAIIVETPKSCKECPLKQIKVLGKTPIYSCLISRKMIIGEGKIECPLKGMPEPLPFAGDEYLKGFNDAIEQLTHI